MPGIDGIEVLSEIKNNFFNTEVIMLTAYEDNDLAVKSLHFGASDFITKPINSDELDIYIKRALKKIYMKNPPPRGRSGATRIYFGTQVKSSPPIFKLFTNAPEAIPAHYRRYLERAIREKFKFEGSPVCLQFSKRMYKKGKG